MRQLQSASFPEPGFGEMWTGSTISQSLEISTFPSKLQHSFCHHNAAKLVVARPKPVVGHVAMRRYCGSCWAFGTTSMLSDRLRIQTQHRFPELVLSAQVLLNCGGGGTCNVSATVSQFLPDVMFVQVTSCNTQVACASMFTCHCDSSCSGLQLPHCHSLVIFWSSKHQAASDLEASDALHDAYKQDGHCMLCAGRQPIWRL